MGRLQTFRSLASGAAVVALLLGVPARAQLSTTTVKGQIKSGEAPVAAGLTVIAVNTATGFTYKTTTEADGTYTITYLQPGTYEIRVTDQTGTAKSEPITLAVGETAYADLTFAKAEAGEQILVTGSRQRRAVKTSEVGANIPPQLIEALPQASRNFLTSVDLVPGVVFQQDAAGNTSIQSGGLNHDNVNVFIDGVGQKNNILRGGLVGQDSSRGNPFPQSAIQEYKVVTQNYKAEFDQVSSAAVTAVTKSGTNDLHGDVYYDRTQTSWRAMSPLEIQKELQGQPLMPSAQNEFGVSLGGPIQKDAVHFFLAYDGKNIHDSRQVIPKNLDKLPSGQGIVPTLTQQGGSYVDAFNEHLIFGKVDARLSDDQKLAISTKIRLEDDHLPEDLNLSAPGNDKQKTNNEYRIDGVLYSDIGEDWVSETRADYEYAVWNPHPNLNAPEFRYKVSTANPPNIGSGQDIILMGGSPDSQRRAQNGFTVAQSMTNRGLESHLFKGGAKLAFFNYGLSGTARAVDVVKTLIDPSTGLPYYDSATGNCTGTNVINNGSNSDQCQIDRALSPTDVSINNFQVGLFVQDDWDLFSRLQLNLGVRWDVETNMMNNGYVTPADRVAALNAPDTRSFPGQTAQPGQTYAQSLAKGGINIADYIADGHSRRVYLGAIAPRVGLSYDVLGDKSTVVFGGYGRSYDRTMANHALDETQKNAQPGGEIWLIRNDFKMPYTDQLSVGVRQAVFSWNVEVVGSFLYGKNQFEWFSGNRDLNGGYFTQASIDPLWGGPAGYGNLILGDFVGETHTRQLLFQAVKPYTRASGWTVTIAYTLSDAKTTTNEWDDNIFDWTYGKPGRQWHPSRLVDKHRLVVGAMADRLLPWDIMTSLKFTYGSGLPRRLFGCTFAGSNPCDFANGGAVAFEGVTTPFKQLDLGVEKRIGTGPGAFAIRADMLNVFNWTNEIRDGNTWAGVWLAPGSNVNRYGLDNLSVDNVTAVRGPMRTFKLSGSYTF